ncbi:MAG: AAA family ATPase [Candidatus Woesearchaeota archaeon]
MEQKKLVIGISGTICSGKDVVAAILKDRGFQLISLGDVIREELRSRGVELTRKTQQDLGNELRKTYGGQILIERALKKYQSYTAPLIISGIRNLDEVNYLKEQTNFILIGVDAPFDVRWKRVQIRNRDQDLLNQDKFVIDDARDRGFNEPLNGQQVGMCLVHADFLINNDETFTRLDDSKLYREVNEIYREVMKKK